MISAGEVALNRLVLLSRGLSSLAFLQFEAIRKSGDPLPNGIGMRCVFDPTLKALQLDFFNNSRGSRPFCRKVNLLDGSFDDCVDLFRKPALSTIRSAFPQKGRNTPGPLIRLNPAIHSCWMLAHYSGYLLNFFKRSFGRSHPIIGLRALNRFTAVCQALSDMGTKSGVHAARSLGNRSGIASRTGMRSSLRLPSSLATMESMSA